MAAASTGANPSPPRRVAGALADFLHDEAAGGIALVVATIGALVWANVSLDGYESVWDAELGADVLDLKLRLDLRHWVNDALMAVFFFVVGLEIKRELVAGELRTRKAAALPVLGAVGGVVAPALIFVAITAGTEEVSGWAIPAATDIAFAVGVMALLGDRVSSGVKLLLLSIAIVDDIVAILIIAVFYSDSLSAIWLLAAAAGLLAVLALRRLGVASIVAYVPIGIFVWIAVHESGVHATIAGVALGLLTPTGSFRGRQVLATLEHRLHPISAFAIVPLFALANAGVSFGGGVLGDAAESRVAWAIAAGLLIGKVIGITGAIFAGLRLGWGTLPEGVERRQIVGLAALAGIGFTVSLFIAQLAYEDPAIVDTAKIGIFAGSALSGILGAVLLIRGARTTTPDPPNESAGGV
jgi:NhaA family Na+:H+ antiporter